MKWCAKCGACYDDGFDLCAVDGGLLTSSVPGPRLIGERYRLDARVAAGAMGTVFRATHLALGSTVALKVINPEYTGNTVIEARFQREARALGQIKHPNAVLVMDFGVDPRGILYLVTEYLRGEPLSKRIEGKKRLSLEDVERIVSPLCDAVVEAHGAGIVHRDIKASNVFLERLRDGSDVVKVLDFGVAKLLTPEEIDPDGLLADMTDEVDQTIKQVPAMSSTTADEVVLSSAELAQLRSTRDSISPIESLTLPGRLLGTLTYMAPEQLTTGEIVPATDVYAIATLIYRMLSGRLPFDGTERQIMAQKHQGRRPSIRDAGVEVPVALDHALQASFALRPSDRPSVDALAQAVREALEATRRGRAATDPKLIERLLGFGRALEALSIALAPLRFPDDYPLARDHLLALDAPMAQLRTVAPLADRIVPRDREAVEAALGALAEGTKRAQIALSAVTDEYLQKLGLRLLKSANESHRAVQTALARVAGPSQSVLERELFEPEGELEQLTEQLEAKDALTAEDALSALMTSHVEAFVATLSGPGNDALADRILRGLWRHADELLLRDLYPEAPAFRVFPFLAKLGTREASAPFRLVAQSFRSGGEPPERDASMFWRCMVMSSRPELRAHALERTRPADLWTPIAFPRTPVRLTAQIFAHVSRVAAPEYLQVFLLCARDSLIHAARKARPEDARELLEAFQLVAALFGVSCLHEDFVFEPLLELEAELRRNADALGVDPGPAYKDAFAAYRDRGPKSGQPIDALRDVPLPIQRKIARGGHFANFFACHPNEKIALETVRHLIKREDIVPVLKLSKIHRSVIVALVKEERLLRTEEAKLALLNNPKTPAFVARKYIPFLPRAQVKALASNKHISGEVRLLASRYVQKFQG